MVQQRNPNPDTSRRCNSKLICQREDETSSIRTEGAKTRGDKCQESKPGKCTEEAMLAIFTVLNLFLMKEPNIDNLAPFIIVCWCPHPLTTNHRNCLDIQDEI